MSDLLLRVLFFGMLGVSLELLFVALRQSWKTKNKALIGHASLFMFPIYGLGLTFGFDIIEFVIPYTIVRWLSYPFWIWMIEIAVGSLAVKRGIRIWDYRYLPKLFHWKGIISFAHLPVWIMFGMTVEFFRNTLLVMG